MGFLVREVRGERAGCVWEWSYPARGMCGICAECGRKVYPVREVCEVSMECVGKVLSCAGCVWMVLSCAGNVRDMCGVCGEGL